MELLVGEAGDLFVGAAEAAAVAASLVATASLFEVSSSLEMVELHSEATVRLDSGRSKKYGKWFLSTPGLGFNTYISDFQIPYFPSPSKLKN